MMARCLFAIFLFVTWVCSPAFGAGVEVAVGGWQQSPAGDLSYKAESRFDKLDLKDDLGYESENRFMGRLKLELPLFFPNIYFVAAPMDFEGTGSKPMDFTFGDQTFSANRDIDSKVTLNQYDLALYWGVPFLRTASAGMFNIDLGINARMVDFSAEVTGESTLVPGELVHEEESLSLVIPMVYAAFQIMPMDRLTIEGEVRGIAIGGNSLYSFIGRLRVHPYGPMFVAGGYRFDSLDVDDDDVDVDMDFSGPFIEVGLQF